MQRTFRQSACAGLVSLLLVQLASTSPLPELDLYPRQGINCSDLNPAAVFDSSCWGGLDLSDWLNNPKTGWNATTPVCTGSQDGSNCCKPSEPWTTCFLRLAHNNPSYDCSQINPQSCPNDAAVSSSLSPSIVPQARYVLKNIYAINSFFTNWYLALPYAIGQAGLMITPVVNELDPPSNTNVALNYLLTALTAGLGLVAGPEVPAGVDGLLAATITAGSVFVKGLAQAPGVAAAIWPVGTDDSTTVQISDIATKLSSSTSQLSARINDGLVLLMSDMPSFVGFASTGGFSGATPLSLAKQTDGIDIALRTLIVSTAMSGNKWQAWAMLDVASPAAFVSLTTCGTMDSNNICGDYWYSSATQRGYSLSNLNGHGPSPNQLMNDIITNNWSTLEVLFDGGYDCTAGPNPGKNPVNIAAGGKLDTSCSSQLPFCVACGKPCPVAEVNGACPFSGCGGKCCGDSLC